jgi:hypothetical protein
MLDMGRFKLDKAFVWFETSHIRLDLWLFMLDMRFVWLDM